MIEVDDNNLKKQLVSAKQLLTFLISFGYKLYNLETNEALDMESSFENCHFDVLCMNK